MEWRAVTEAIAKNGFEQGASYRKGYLFSCTLTE